MLTELQKGFFSRLQMSPIEEVKFKDLHEILLQMAYVIPYENLDVMEKISEKLLERMFKKKYY